MNFSRSISWLWKNSRIHLNSRFPFSRGRTEANASPPLPTAQFDHPFSEVDTDLSDRSVLCRFRGRLKKLGLRWNPADAGPEVETLRACRASVRFPAPTATVPKYFLPMPGVSHPDWKSFQDRSSRSRFPVRFLKIASNQTLFTQ